MSVFVASIWIEEDTDPDARRLDVGRSLVEALGWPLVKLLDATRPPLPFRLSDQE